MNKDKTIGLGVIGFGSFALFAVQQFMQIPGINLIGIAGTHREAADAAAKRFGALRLAEIEDLVNLPEVDLVYIATPPFLHYEQSMLALNAGKNVICEKPLAVTIEQAEEMIKKANEKGLLLTVNLMQRYNPLYAAVKNIIEQKPLGELLHGYFENYASDEGLEPEHWFWDRSKSGGIFIEHSVHFFDMFEGWLGEGNVLCSSSVKRAETGIEEQVHAMVRYRDGIVVNQYHGFTQPGKMDRQELRLLFEKGEITLYEWVPTRMILNGLCDEKDTKILMDLFPGSKLKIEEFYAGNYRKFRARHKDLDIYQKIQIIYEQERTKYYIYGDIVKAMMIDQIAWLNDKNHKRLITEKNGYNSLKMAVNAANKSENT